MYAERGPEVLVLKVVKYCAGAIEEVSRFGREDRRCGRCRGVKSGVKR